MPRVYPLLALLGCLAIPIGPVRAQADKPLTAARNVIVVTTDGLRPQEVFGGLDPAYNRPENGVDDPAALAEEFGGATPELRRAKLLPFLWQRIDAGAPVFGGPGVPARVSNGKNFSFPGYNELFAGFADPRVDSNAKRPNPNRTVLEWLDGRPGFAGKVRAHTSWDVFEWIFRAESSGLPVRAGRPRREAEGDAVDRTRPDPETMAEALTALRDDRPRVLYVSLNDTDESAHANQYDKYLHEAHAFDDFLRRLWEAVESIDEYRGRTAFVVSTDHGRGLTPADWMNHNAATPGSEQLWIVAYGAGVTTGGDTRSEGPATQSQVAATIAALLGEDYNQAEPRAARPLSGVVAGRP